MALIISSALSPNMMPLTKSTYMELHPIDLDEARELIADSGDITNMVNPRHQSTARLSELLCGKPAEGGLLEIKGGQKGTILVMLPPREFMNRDGAEIEVKDLEEVVFFEVGINR